MSGVIQIKDDMIVHGKGEKHGKNLRKVFERLREHSIMLNLDKCHLGLSEVKWFKMLFSKVGMSKDPAKMD